MHSVVIRLHHRLRLSTVLPALPSYIPFLSLSFVYINFSSSLQHHHPLLLFFFFFFQEATLGLDWIPVNSYYS